MTRSWAAPALAQPGAAVTKLPLSRTALPASATPAGPRAGKGSGVGDRVHLIPLSPGEKQPGVQPLRNPGPLRSSPPLAPLLPAPVRTWVLGVDLGTWVLSWARSNPGAKARPRPLPA